MLCQSDWSHSAVYVLYRTVLFSFIVQSSMSVSGLVSGVSVPVSSLYANKRRNEPYKMNVIVSLLKALHAILNMFSKENSYRYTFQTEKPRNNNTTSTIRFFFIGGDRLSTVSRLFVEIPNFLCIKGKIV